MIAADRAVMAEFPSARAALAVFTQSCRHGARGVVDDYAILGRPWGFAVEEITVPVHCWHATADKVVPLHHTEALAHRIPDARLTHWPNEGHLAIVESHRRSLRRVARAQPALSLRHHDAEFESTSIATVVRSSPTVIWPV